MRITLKKLAILLISTLIIGTLIGWYWHKSTVQSVLPREMQKKVDSLIYVTDSIEVEKIKYVTQVKKVVEERVVEIENVKSLPLDSGVVLLKNQIEEYEKNY